MPPAKKTTPEKSVAKKTSAEKVPANKPAEKKVSATKLSAAKTSAKKTTAKLIAAATAKRNAPPTTSLRGRALADLVIAHLAGPDSPIGEAHPLRADQRARIEKAMGVALSPFMATVFAYDIGWLSREIDLFDDAGMMRVAPCVEIIRAHAGNFAASYEPWCAGRLTGKAAQLDAGSDSMRFVYFGAADEHGEYPVLNIDHDDSPLLDVTAAGFDLWMAEVLGIELAGAESAATAASLRILGSKSAREMRPDDIPDFASLPKLSATPGAASTKPAPAAIAEAPKPPAPIVDEPKKKLADEPKKKLTDEPKKKAAATAPSDEPKKKLAATAPPADPPKKLAAVAPPPADLPKKPPAAAPPADLPKKPPAAAAPPPADPPKKPAAIVAPPPAAPPKRVAAPPPPEDPAKKLAAEIIATALCESATEGNLELLKGLLHESGAFGVDRKAFDEALVEACVVKQRACMSALLEAGASAGARNPRGSALTQLITHGGDIDLVRMMLDAGASPDSPGVNGQTAIFAAVARGDEAITKLLIERGADVNHKAADELLPLHEAVRAQRDPRFIDILCEAGANPDLCRKQSSPLVWAVQEASIDHVRRLLAHGAWVDRRAAHLDQTALHAAFSYGRDDVAAVLVRAGADRKARDERGISLERVYGSDGSDARTVAVRYTPSAEPQDLRVTFEVAVTNPEQAPSACSPALDGAHWSALAKAGVAAEGDFDAEASQIEVIQSFDKTSLGKAGFHKLELTLRVTGISAGFVRWMVLSALGGPRVLTAQDGGDVASPAGARTDAALRVVSIDARGSVDAPPMNLPTLRNWATTTATPAVSPAPLPFELGTRVGEKSEIVITPKDANIAPQALTEALQRAMTGWATLLERVPRRPDASPFSLTAVPQPMSEGVVHIDLVDALTQKSLRLPWSTEALIPQLGQVLRAVHAHTPIAKVDLVVAE